MHCIDILICSHVYFITANTAQWAYLTTSDATLPSNMEIDPFDTIRGIKRRIKGIKKGDNKKNESI